MIGDRTCEWVGEVGVPGEGQEAHHRCVEVLNNPMVASGLYPAGRGWLNGQIARPSGTSERCLGWAYPFRFLVYLATLPPNRFDAFWPKLLYFIRRRRLLQQWLPVFQFIHGQPLQDLLGHIANVSSLWNGVS